MGIRLISDWNFPFFGKTIHESEGWHTCHKINQLIISVL